MSAVLDNVVTTAAWQELSCPNTSRLVIFVSNAAIDVQLGRSERRGAPVAWDEPTKPYFPAYFGLDRRCDAVRVRSKLASAPARVSIEALTAREVGGDG